MSAVIDVSGLTKRFGSRPAVDDLSFTVEAGRICGFLGPNGAGKTTTIRALLGLVHPTAGSATILGQRYRALDDPLRRVGAVLETSGFHPGRTARNHLRYLTTATGIPDARVGEVLELVDLAKDAKTRVGKFSMGMKQRLGLAASLLGDPEVLLLDEPANGLDPIGMRWLRQFLREQADRGRTILVSSHVLAEVAQTVDEVVIITKGKSVLQASIPELRAMAGKGVRVRARRAAPLLAALDAAGHEYRIEGRNELVIMGATAAAVGQLAAAASVPLLELSEQGADLESVFLKLVGPEEPPDFADWSYEEEEARL